MKNPNVYLSDPMDNVDESEGKGWRETATEFFALHSISTFNPYDFEENVNNPPALVKTDIIYMAKSHGMLINASQPVVVWGSPMEVLWGAQHGLINIAFTGDLKVSPWLSAHSIITTTLEQAMEQMVWKLSRL